MQNIKVASVCSAVSMRFAGAKDVMRKFFAKKQEKEL